MSSSHSCFYDRSVLVSTFDRLIEIFESRGCDHLSLDLADEMPVLVIFDSWCGRIVGEGTRACSKALSDIGYVAGTNFSRFDARASIVLKSNDPEHLQFAKETEIETYGEDAWRDEIELDLPLPAYYTKGFRKVVDVSDHRFRFRCPHAGDKRRTYASVLVKRFVPYDGHNVLPSPGPTPPPLSVYVLEASQEDRGCPSNSGGRSKNACEVEKDAEESSEVSTTDVVDENRQSITVLIVTTLQVEYQAVRNNLDTVVEEVHHTGTIYEIGSFKGMHVDWRVVLVQCAAGNVDAAMETVLGVERQDAELLLFVGVAGGLKDVQVGDIVASSEVLGYESGKDGTEFLPRARVVLASYRLAQRAKAVAREESWWDRLGLKVTTAWPRAFVGPIAAGEKIVASKRSSSATRLSRLFSHALAVEMEGEGVLAAAHNLQAEGIVVRGISDLLKAPHDLVEEERQRIASANAAAFAFELLHRFR